MRRPLLALTLAASALVGVSVRAADSVVFTRFSDYLEALRVQAGIPGLAAIVVTSTDVVWERGFGLRDVERSLPALPDTPFEVDGLTQTITASLALRCNDSGYLSVDARVAQFAPGSPDAGATLRNLLSHTSPGPSGLVFSYRLDRLAPMAPAISSCTDSSFRFGIGALFDRMGMSDSVPGLDVARLTPGAEQFDAGKLQRYAGVLARLAVPYAVDAKGHASPSSYAVTSLSPAGGLISTVRDLAKFDLALKNGIVMRPPTLADAWTPPLDRPGGQSLPHALGWFVQAYNGEPIVWQYGVSDNASSSLIVTAPRRGLTMILLANSSGLAQSIVPATGDVTASPFARLFLGLFLR